MVLVAATAFAQAKTDFNGKWTREMAAGAAAGGGGGGRAAGGGGGGGQRGGGGMGGGGGLNCGMTCDIVQTAASLKVTRVQGEATIVAEFKLDGSESKNTAPGRGGAPGVEVVSKAKWDGNKIVITTERAGQDGTKITSTQTLAIDGGKMTISSTNSMQADAPPQVQTYTKG